MKDVKNIPKKDTKVASQFEEIIPFEQFLTPAFPTECFPDWIKNYFEAVAENTQTPKDLASVIGLSVFAAALAGFIKIQGKTDWEEPLNLYTAVVMSPAERKSSVFNQIIKPLIECEEETNIKLELAIIENRIEKEILINTLKDLKKELSKNNSNELIKKIKEKATELERFIDIKCLRLVADDVTPEKATSLLAENNGRIAIMSSEGGIFQIMAGRYSNSKCNLDVFLKAYCGDAIIVDRVGRPYEHIIDPVLTMGLTIQPTVLRAVMSNPDFTGKGLSARFLFSIPKSKVGRRNIKSQSIPTEYKNVYFKNVKALLDKSQVQKEFAKINNNKDKVDIHILHLSKEAMEKSFEFAEELEPRLIGDLQFIKEWSGKLHGTVLRIAGILHCTENVETFNFWDVEVSSATLDKAIRIGFYFIEHYKAVFGLMGANPNIESAKFILKFIKDNDLRKFTKREIQRGNQTRFKNVESMVPVLKLLIESNFICEEQVFYDGVGRKPKNIYIVNPSYK